MRMEKVAMNHCLLLSDLLLLLLLTLIRREPVVHDARPGLLELSPQPDVGHEGQLRARQVHVALAS